MIPLYSGPRLLSGPSFRNFVGERLFGTLSSSDLGTILADAITLGVGGISELYRLNQNVPQSIVPSQDVLPMPLPDITKRVSRDFHRHRHKSRKSLGPSYSTSIFSRMAALGTNYMFCGMTKLLSSSLFPSPSYMDIHGHMYDLTTIAARRMVKCGINLTRDLVLSKIKGFNASYGGARLNVANKLTSEQILGGLPPVGLGGSVPHSLGVHWIYVGLGL